MKKFFRLVDCRCVDLAGFIKLNENSMLFDRLIHCNHLPRNLLIPSFAHQGNKVILIQDSFKHRNIRKTIYPDPGILARNVFIVYFLKSFQIIFLKSEDNSERSNRKMIQIRDVLTKNCTVPRFRDRLKSGF